MQKEYSLAEDEFEAKVVRNREKMKKKRGNTLRDSKR